MKAVFTILLLCSALYAAAQPKLSDKDFKNRPDYMHVFVEEMEQVIDVERGIEILKFELIRSGLHTQDDMKTVEEHQQQKCVEHGHHVPESKEAA